MSSVDATGTSSRWAAVRAVLRCEWQLLRRYPRLAVAFAGVLFVPAVYAWIYLYAIWDPTSHARDLPVGLVNLDSGAQYRAQQLNLGRDVLGAIERQAQFAYRRYDDAAQARRDVRRGQLAFMLEIPQDFSRRALPGEQPGAAKVVIYASEGNNYASAGFARQFAPEVAQRVNTMLGEVRWDLVLSSADGSQRNLDTLRDALGALQRSSAELNAALVQARDGSAQLVTHGAGAIEAAGRLRAGSGQVAEGAQYMGGSLRQVASVVRATGTRPGPEADLQALRQGLGAQVDGQRELLRGMETLGSASRELGQGIEQFRAAVEEVPLFSGRLGEGIAPIADGVQQLGRGLDQARDGQLRLVQGSQRLQDGAAAAAEAALRLSQSMAALSARLPEDARIDSFSEGARELAQGHDALVGGLRQLNSGALALQGGLQRVAEGAGRLDTGMALVRQTLPSSVQRPEGSAQGLAMSVEPELEMVAPVPTQGGALLPNFVPLALWVGAMMVAFLVNLRRVPAALAQHSRWVLAAGKLALPLGVVLLQALLMLAMLTFVLKVPVQHPALLALLLLTSSAAFIGIVWALVRLLGDLGKVAAVLLLIVQLSAAGALLPIELSDEAFQAIHPYLPLTWVVQALRVSLFGAFDGAFWPPYAMVAAVASGSLLLGALVGHWRGVSDADWRPPLDIE